MAEIETATRSKYDAVIAAGQKNKEKDYWLNKLSGEWVKSNFPYDYNTNHNYNRDIHKKQHENNREDKKEAGLRDVVNISFSPAINARLMQLRNGSDHRLHMILTAAVIVMLQEYTGNSDVIVGSPVLKQSNDLNFINTVLPLRNQCQDTMTFKELLLQVRQTVFEAAEHQNYPMEVLLNQLNLSITGNGFPLFDVAVLVDNIHDKEYIRHTSPAVIFSFIRAGDDGVVAGEIEYNTNLYEKATVERIAIHLEQLLQGLLFNGDMPFSHIDFITEEEKEQILFAFNKEPEPVDTTKTVYEWFQEQVEKYPDNTAVVFENNKLTYVELNSKANRLARLLRKRGVGPNRIAALLFDWSLDMIVAMLATLKAGAAYLPIDPDYPEDRVFTILEDSRAAVVLTTSAIVERFFFTSLQGLHKVKMAPYMTAPRPAVTDLDSLPIPDRTLVDYEKYNHYIGQAGIKETYMTLLTTRGCPYQCAYCHKIWPRKHAARSAENIFSEVRLFYNMGVRRFVITDDIFNLDVKNSSRFFQFIIKNNMDLHLFFPNGLRGDILAKDYIDLMVEAGTVNIALALETASPRLQKLIGKNLNIEKLRANLRYLCEKYPHVVSELFIMHGFPTETEEEAMMTLDFIKSLKWLHMPFFNILRIYLNTEMEKLAVANGISRKEIYKWEKLTSGEIPDFLPFDKSFTLKYRSDFLNEYFLSKERFLHVLPHQMRVFTEKELVQRYDSYLPADIDTFDDLMDFIGINQEDLEEDKFLQEGQVSVPDLNRRLTGVFPVKAVKDDALRVLLLDISQFFSLQGEQFFDLYDPPLGLMYLMTVLDREFGNKIKGKVAKARVDFDSYAELKELVKSFEPDVIGIRALSIYKDFFHKTAAVISSWGIDCPLITGGPYASSSPEEVLQDRNVDLVVMGEGEITFARLIEGIIENNGKLPGEGVLRDIAGIVFIPGVQRERGLYAREIFQLDVLETDGVLAEQYAENPAKVNQDTDPAYVIYTSGSTGTPKGILVEHRCLIDFTGWAVVEFEHRPGYQVLLSNSYASDGSIQQIFPPLVSGGTLHLVRPDLRLDAPNYVKYLKENKINNIDEVPVVMNLIFESVQLDETRELLPNLTCLSLGSEFVPIEVARKSRKYLNHEGRIINAYGPAETSVETCAYHFDGRWEKEKSLIGKPRRNLQVYIMDKRENLCAIGVAGEISIGGFGVARGYLNRPELTAEKFDQDLWDFQYCHDERKKNNEKLLRGAKGGGVQKEPLGRRRLYKTGDQGRWQADGNIEFLGRIDNQVNIRGYRVELGEIENWLLDHEAIFEAVVLIKENEGEKYLCAYIVVIPDQDQVVSQSDIRKYLCQKLPEYMVPLYFLKLDRIPLNPNGKIDRNALPDPQVSAVSNYIPPANETEEQLADIWSEVLNVDKGVISVNADFFELGGHSLKTINLIAKILKVLKVKIPVKEIFRLKTIRELVKFIRAAKKEKFVSIQPAKKKEFYALSSAQKRMYILWEVSPETQLYNMFYIIPLLYGPIDKGHLEDTFKKLIHRHESLRTSFEVRGGEPFQFIHEQVDFAMDYYEVKGESVDNAMVGAGVEAITKEFFQPFDLGKAPLLRAGFLTLDENRYLLLIDLHHIISDGVSQGVLEREFFALERGEELPPLRLQYKDYSEWQNRMREQGVLEQQEMYWLQQFTGELPELHLPTDYSRPAVKIYQGAFVFFYADSQLTAGVNHLVSAAGVTQYMVLLAAFYVLLSKYTRQEDIVVGSPITGRRHADLQDVIGMFVNMLPMRNCLGNNKTFGEFLLEVKEKAFQAYENQEYQFDDLVNELGVERSRNRHPLFDVVLAMANISSGSGSPLENYSNTGEGCGEDEKTRHKVQFGYMEANYVWSRYDLLMEVEEAGGKIKGHVEYSTELFKRATIERFINRYFSILEQVIENSDIKIKDIVIPHELLTVKSTTAAEELQDEFDL